MYWHYKYCLDSHKFLSLGNGNQDELDPSNQEPSHGSQPEFEAATQNYFRNRPRMAQIAMKVSTVIYYLNCPPIKNMNPPSQFYIPTQHFLSMSPEKKRDKENR